MRRPAGGFCVGAGGATKGPSRPSHVPRSPRPWAGAEAGAWVPLSRGTAGRGATQPTPPATLQLASRNSLELENSEEEKKKILKNRN